MKKKPGINKKIDDSLGKRVREIRKRLKLIQKDFAQKINFSVPSLSDIETGKSKPGHDFFYHIVKAFDVNLYFLLFGEGEMFRTDDKSLEKQFKIPKEITPETREFLDYFFHSTIMQYSLMASFRRILHQEGEIIKQEVEKSRLSDPG